jgi:hypothetical protein
MLYFFSSVFNHQNPGSGLDPNLNPDSLEMLDPDSYPHPDSIIPDPQLCFEENKLTLLKYRNSGRMASPF